MINGCHYVIDAKQTFCIWGNRCRFKGLSLSDNKQGNGNGNQSKKPLHFDDFIISQLTVFFKTQTKTPHVLCV